MKDKNKRSSSRNTFVSVVKIIDKGRGYIINEETEDKFYLKRNHVGRALDGAIPKWYRYSGVASYYKRCIGKPNGIYVIVEDVISAITVAKLGFTGMAILGTSLSVAHMEQLGNYSQVIVALDPDAAHKTLRFRQEIEAWTGATTIALRLDDDIKYRVESDIEQLKEFL